MQDDKQICVSKLQPGAASVVIDEVPPRIAMFAPVQGPVGRAAAYQQECKDHLGMFVHSERLKRHGRFGFSIVDPDKPCPEPSVAAIRQNDSMKFVSPRDAGVVVHDDGCPGVRVPEGVYLHLGQVSRWPNQRHSARRHKVLQPRRYASITDQAKNLVQVIIYLSWINVGSPRGPKSSCYFCASGWGKGSSTDQILCI